MRLESSFNRIQKNFYAIFAAGKRVVVKTGNRFCAVVLSVEYDFISL